MKEARIMRKSKIKTKNKEERSNIQEDWRDKKEERRNTKYKIRKKQEDIIHMQE